MALSPEVKAALQDAASALLRASNAWDYDIDQVAWDQSQTTIADALGASLDEVAATIFAFVGEATA